MSSTYGGPSGQAGTEPTARERPEAGAAYEPREATAGGGAMALAGWLLMLGGLWSFFLGLALIAKASYFRSLASYSTLTNYTYHWNLSGWGWLHLALGIVTVAAGMCVLFAFTWARWAGVVLAVFSGLATFMFLPFYPLWSIVVLAIDVFIIWALLAAWRPQEI